MDSEDHYIKYFNFNKFSIVPKKYMLGIKKKNSNTAIAVIEHGLI